MLEKLKSKAFEIRCESHAAAILEQDFPSALQELEKALLKLTVPITEIIGSGGGETKGTACTEPRGASSSPARVLFHPPSCPKNGKRAPSAKHRHEARPPFRRCA